MPLSAVVNLDVVYPSHSLETEIPNDWLARALAEARKNLEIAVTLENEVGSGFSLGRLAPINPSNDAEVDGYDRTHGLSAAMIRHARETKTLSQFDGEAAKREVINWLGLEGAPFERLRLWAAGDPGLTAIEISRQIFESIDEDTFWDPYHERDFLLSLAARWAELGEAATDAIEDRILKGRTRWDDEDEAIYQERRVDRVLSRLHWLSANSCVLNLDLAAETERLKEIIPDWSEGAVQGVARSMESRSGWVRTDSEYNELLDIPLTAVLAAAANAQRSRGPLLVERKPFVGLSAEKPVRALMVLKSAGRSGD